MNLRSIVIGSRGSRLALWQAHYVQSLLKEQGVESRIEIIKTQGDRIQHLSFDKLEGKGFFTKEIEAALLDSSIDLAVHSHKDLETVQPDGLCIAALPQRADARDVLVVRKAVLQADNLFCLPSMPRIGTSSARRRAQLKHHLPDVQLVDIRGNVPTRLEKLHSLELDAIVLAKAGLDRLEIEPENAVVIPLGIDLVVPAPAQGALALQVREDDEVLRKALVYLNDAVMAGHVAAERFVLRGLDGGCQLPFGAHVNAVGDRVEMRAFYGAESGTRTVHLAGKSADAMAEITLELLRKGIAGKPNVLISRSANQSRELSEVLADWNVKVAAQSFIEIEQLSFTTPKDASDWIFFPSVNAANAYLSTSTVPKESKVAAMGPGTAKALAARGVYADFTGLGARADETGAAFAKEAGTSTVLIAGALKMRGTVAGFLKQEQVTVLPVYQTVPNPVACSPADVVVLTSASNARSFLEGNAWGQDAKHVLATGTAAEVFAGTSVQNLQVLDSLELPAVLCAIFAALLGYSGEY